MKINEPFYKQLDGDKIKINNKNPIKINLFLSFLKIEVIKSTSHLGYSTGWTQYENKDHKLVIRGGIVSGIDYLDNIQYGNKLSNIYNNYVNPFYLFKHLTSEGKKFFLKYYKEDITKILSLKKLELENLKSKLNNEELVYINLKSEITNLKQQ